MFTKAFAAALLAVVTFAPSPSFAHSHHRRADSAYTTLPKIVSGLTEGEASNDSSTGAGAPFSAGKFEAVKKVLEGNLRFQQDRDASFIQSLVDDGQKPPFMMISCSDSRAPEATIFDSEPGTFFMERNIANQYKPGDENAQSVMAYGITVLGVQHIVVLGHYGCGGVAASIASAPKTGIDVASHIVQTWIGDIRQLYLSSDRPEIVEMRDANLAIEAQGGIVEEPEVQDPGFRALVEENVKQQVTRITQSSVISNLHDRLAAAGPEGLRRRAGEAAPLIPVFVHGWVHDIETGEVIDLNVSTGPAGFENFIPDESEAVAPPAEEAPVEEAPIEEAPVEEPPVEETPVEEAPVADAPVEDPVAETPAETIASSTVASEPAPTPESANVGGTGVNPLGHSTIPARKARRNSFGSLFKNNGKRSPKWSRDARRI